MKIYVTPRKEEAKSFDIVITFILHLQYTKENAMKRPAYCQFSYDLYICCVRSLIFLSFARINIEREISSSHVRDLCVFSTLLDKNRKNIFANILNFSFRIHRLFDSVTREIYGMTHKLLSLAFILQICGHVIKGTLATRSDCATLKVKLIIARFICRNVMPINTLLDK